MKPRSTFGAILVVIGLIGLYYVFTNEGKSPLETWNSLIGQHDVYEQDSIDLQGADNLNVKSDSLDVILVRGNGSEATATLSGQASKKYISTLDLHTQVKGDTLYVEVESKSSFQIGFNWNSVKLTVAIPEQTWNDLTIQTSSGDIELKQQQFVNANIQLSSGDIEAKDFIVTDNLVVQSSSGDIELEQFESRSVKVQANSGDLEVKQYTAEHIEFLTGSGDVDFHDGSSKLVGRTSSGDISLRAAELQQDTELTTGSGDVSVKLERDPSSLEINFTTGSGDGVIRKSGFTHQEFSNKEENIHGSFGDGKIKLSVATGSGDFVLR